MLFETECGRANGGDSFTPLESRILQAPVEPSSRAGASHMDGSTAVFFCRDFQHGACKLTKHHYGTLRGEWKWQQLICARCWVDTRVAARHTEFSKECPLVVEKNSNSSAPTTPWLQLLEPLDHDSLCLQDSRLSVSDFKPDSSLNAFFQDSISSLEDQCYLDSRLHRMVHSYYGSESDTPLLSSQETVPSVLMMFSHRCR